MAIFGYARVSTLDQNLDSQKDELSKYGCSKIFFEKVSGKNVERPALIELVNDLAARKVEFVSIADKIDTASAVGKLMFHLIGAFAEFERNLISERTKLGLASARARGRSGGKPKGLSPAAQKKAIRVKELYDKRELSIEEICKVLEIKSKTTLYKYLRFENERLKKIENEK